MAPALLSPKEAIRYWDERHRREDELRSGGDIGLDPAANEIFYVTRLGKLLEIIGDRNSPRLSQFVLDAGCGKGYFAHALVRCGFAVDGIDTSETAIARCRAEGGGRYSVSDLRAWRSPWLYDVVYSVDVLFHVLDDTLWEAGLRNLASLVRLTGMLVITDESNEQRRQAGNYIVHRARAEYLDVLSDCGFTLRDFRPYAFRDNAVGFFTFLRVG